MRLAMCRTTYRAQSLCVPLPRVASSRLGPSHVGLRLYQGGGKRVSNRKALAQIDLHWHDLRHEALSRLADDGVPVHELQLLAGHSSITTTQRYMNARASSLAESMRQARERRINRVESADEATAQIG